MSVRTVLIVLVLVGTAAVAVPLAHLHWSADGATSSGRALNADGSASLPQSPSSSIACTGVAGSSASHDTLQDIADRAQTLLAQQHVTEALARYDDLQQMDPGFPGLQLGRATALVADRRFDEAIHVVNRQVSISQCLERLPASTLESYCKREMPLVSADACHATLKSVERRAHLEAAIAQMQLSNPNEGARALSTSVSAAVETDPIPEPTPLQPAFTKPRPVLHAAATHRAAPKADPLASASGTDAALGAYSR